MLEAADLRGSQEQRGARHKAPDLLCVTTKARLLSVVCYNNKDTALANSVSSSRMATPDLL